MDANRRRHLRKTPDELAFIQIERDEVGTVRNVSEGGLSFTSFAPVPQLGPFYFWLSFNLKDRIEAMGELAWADASGKIGGLRFTQLTQRGREQIRRWLSRLPSEGAVEPEPVLQVVSKGERKKGGAGQLNRVARFVAKARSPRPPLSLNLEASESRELSPAFASSVSLSPSVLASQGIEAPAGLVPLQKYLSVKKKQLIRGVLLGVGLSAAVGASAFLYWNHRSHAANSAAHVVESLPAKNDIPAQPTRPQAEQTSGVPAVAIFSSGSPIRGAASERSASRPVSDSYPLLRGSGAEPNPAKPSAPASDPLQPSGKASQSKKPMTRAQLWAAVQAGSTKAAVELAEHYIKGDGVPQNCQQARVLLLMASEKRDPAAIKRLQELDKDPSTCP